MPRRRRPACAKIRLYAEMKALNLRIICIEYLPFAEIKPYNLRKLCRDYIFTNNPAGLALNGDKRNWPIN